MPPRKNSPNLVEDLHRALIGLSEYEYPFVANPPKAPKRASVAIIIRVSPTYAHWPPTEAFQTDQKSSTSLQQRLDDFFAQDWVKHGEAEVLFIKRSSREEDKWSSHIAVPGGRRDPGDDDDKAAAVRETMEEVGIHLTEENAISVGNLSQRVVTTSWGAKPIMVYCPYVFLLTKHDIPPLRLQPTEIASAHWVSIRALLSPTQRTVESIDVARRYAKEMRGWRLHLFLGDMIFAAIRLIPSESVYSSEQPGFVPSLPKRQATLSRFRRWMSEDPVPAPSVDSPLHLWGLTLGVIADFLDLVQPKDAIRLWIYPTFTAVDVQFVLWAITHSFRSRKAKLLEVDDSQTGGQSLGTTDKRMLPIRNESFAGTQPSSGVATPDRSTASAPQAGIEGLGVGGGPHSVSTPSKAGMRSNAIESLLEGYADYIKRAVQITLLGRAALAGGILFYVVRRSRR